MCTEVSGEAFCIAHVVGSVSMGGSLGMIYVEAIDTCAGNANVCFVCYSHRCVCVCVCGEDVALIWTGRCFGWKRCLNYLV